MAESKAGGNGTNQAQPTKVEAVRQALKKLGKDAKAADIQKFARDAFGLDITIKHVYNCLSEIRKQGKDKTATTKGPKKAVPTPVPAAAQTRPASPPRPAPAKGVAGGIDLKDIAAVKGLVERVGPEKLRSLIEVLAR